MGNGLIFAFVVALWAAYFVPLALRRYDEASKSGSIDKFSSLSRVIGNKRVDADNRFVSGKLLVEDENGSDEPAETMDHDAPATTQGAAEDGAAQDGTAQNGDADVVAQDVPAPRINRAAARLAARRRRRTLLTLVVLTAIVGGVIGFSLLPMWAVAIPLGLDTVWLVACRVQVRSERGVSQKATTTTTRRSKKTKRRRVSAAASRAVKSTGSLFGRLMAARSRIQSERTGSESSYDPEATVVLSGQYEDVEPDRKHVMARDELPTDALEQKLEIAVPVSSTSGTALWDPLPVTVPTYVTKPRAGRTVRTIDFAEPGMWTSGHVEGEDVELPQRKSDTHDEPQRAVGH